MTDLVTAINTSVKVQTSPSGVAEAKQQALTTAGDLAFEIAGALLSFTEVSDSPDLTLAARVRWSRSAITAGSSNAVVARIQDVIDAATEDLESLGKHGVSRPR